MSLFPRGERLVIRSTFSNVTCRRYSDLTCYPPTRRYLYFVKYKARCFDDVGTMSSYSLSKFLFYIGSSVIFCSYYIPINDENRE